MVGWAIRTKNCCGHLQLILCCFLFIISLHTKFHSNLSENTKVENFRYWSVLVGRAGWSKNGLRYFKLILCCFGAIISPHTKFHPNRTKNTEYAFLRFMNVEQCHSKKLLCFKDENIWNIHVPGLKTSFPYYS